MQSGFTGGGGGGGGLPDFYATAGRSIATAMNNAPSQQPPYTRPNLPGFFLDPATSRIARQNPVSSMIGKRTLAEFQSHHQYLPNQGLAQVNYLRSVKPRAYQHSSPISPLSPIEFSPTTTTASETSSSSSSSQRFALPMLQQLRPQPIAPSMQGAPYVNGAVQNRIPAVDSEKKMINHRLQELEKQLLDDNDEEEGDPGSVITNNSSSEWSETIQNLISPNQNQSQKPVSPSPTSSSSSSSSSVASPATTTCSKQSLMEAASAISEGKTEAAAEILTRVGQVVSNANPRPNSEQRVLEFVASALKLRAMPAENTPPVIELFSPEHSAAVQSLHDISPCFGLGIMAANLAILEATLPDQQPASNTTTTNNKIHVLDFDIGQGGQYVSLLHALSERQQVPVAVKITTLAETNGSGQERLNSVVEKLRQLAERLGIALEFNVVSRKISELSRESIGCDADEPLAVNFAFMLYRTPDESVSTENPRDELLRRVKAMTPRVVVLVEQELNTNTAPFMARVNETCAYYGALLDSIDSTAAREYSERVKAVEEALSRKLANSVACEGRDRVERCEVFGKWRARMGMAGFELKPLSQNVKTRLGSGNRVHPGFTVKEENGGVWFGWMGRTLTVASAWR